MHDIIDLDHYPLGQADNAKYRALVTDCKARLAKDGLFNLTGFLRPGALEMAVKEVVRVLAKDAFVHARKHNIYFKKAIDGLAVDHPALRMFETSNSTICADQMGQAVMIRLYEWPPFAQFLADVMGKQRLFVMDDPLARVNVMGYAQGQALNWHFDRSEFTTTLLLQAPIEGGAFEYDQDLRADDNPNYAGVADLLEGRRSPVQMPLKAGTLNVFRGKNTAHRVTPVRGGTDRIIAVFSYYQHPGVDFSKEERLGFYGRAE